MTRENFTAIAVILDASGSMAHLTSDTIGSFNQFLSEQKTVPGEAVFSLCTFNTDYHLVHDFVPLQNVSELTNKTYRATGGTALLDAMGTTIDSLGAKLAAMPEEDRPSKIVIVVQTDGEENSSKHFTLEQIKAKVVHQQEKYSWVFVFLGANIDAISTGASLGVTRGNTANYVSSSMGTRSLYSTVSNSMTSYRSAGSPRADFFAQPMDLIPEDANAVVPAVGTPVVPVDNTVATPVSVSTSTKSKKPSRSRTSAVRQTVKRSVKKTSRKSK